MVKKFNYNTCGLISKHGLGLRRGHLHLQEDIKDKMASTKVDTLPELNTQQTSPKPVGENEVIKPDPSRPLPLQPITVEQSAVVKSQGKEKEGWIEAIKKELANLKQTLRVATKEEKDQLYRNKGKPVPSRMVFVQKPDKKESTPSGVRPIPGR